MITSLGQKKRNDYLMRWIFIGSIIVHGVLFLYLSHAYRFRETISLELTLNAIDQPPPRSIPRPRIMKEAPRKNHDEANPISPTEKLSFKLPDDLKESPLSQPIPDNLAAPAKGTLISDISGLNPGATETYFTQNDFMDMIRLKIESKKEYPGEAKKNHIEGKVIVQFVITKDGQLTSLKISKSSKNEILDQAALRAVQEASPFSPLPESLFKGALRLEIAIVFEIT